MESVQRSAESSEETINSAQVPKLGKTEKLVDVQAINPALDPGPTFKYSAEANDASYDSKRVKRAALPANRNNKKTCHLYIQTDPLFWRHIYKQVLIQKMIVQTTELKDSCIVPYNECQNWF